jgi:hypothetical protein
MAKPLVDFENDKAIIALTKAGLEADEPGMAAVLPAESKAFDLHMVGLNLWIVAVNRGAILSKKVVQVADILMIAISIYQVWKLPANLVTKEEPCQFPC